MRGVDTAGVRLVNAEPLRKPPLTVEEYLALDARGAFGADKTELINGVIHTMSPESARHYLMKDDVADGLKARIGAPCRVYVDGPKIPIDATTRIRPDIVVQCDPIDRDAPDITTERPVLVVEVLAGGGNPERDYVQRPAQLLLLESMVAYAVVDVRQRDVAIRVYDRGGEFACASVEDVVEELVRRLAAARQVTTPR